MVPVGVHAEAHDIYGCARGMVRVTTAARDGSATRDELSGSTITLTSLGTLGGIAATPVIMVTAESKTENVIAAKQAGVNNYIVKPFNADTLKSKIEAVFLTPQAG